MATQEFNAVAVHSTRRVDSDLPVGQICKPGANEVKGSADIGATFVFGPEGAEFDAATDLRSKQVDLVQEQDDRSLLEKVALAELSEEQQRVKQGFRWISIQCHMGWAFR
jgi:hypothetical protein